MSIAFNQMRDTTKTNCIVCIRLPKEPCATLWIALLFDRLKKCLVAIALSTNLESMALAAT